MSEEKFSLKQLAKRIEGEVRKLGFDMKYKVKEVYSDFGANEMHKTIVASGPEGEHSFQIFYSSQLKAIESGELSDEDLDEIVEDIIKRHKRYFVIWDVKRISSLV